MLFKQSGHSIFSFFSKLIGKENFILFFSLLLSKKAFNGRTFASGTSTGARSKGWLSTFYSFEDKIF